MRISLKIFFTVAVMQNLLFAVVMEEGNLYREKQELMEVKDELNEFYELKELEYQKQKAELESIHKKIKADEENIIKVRDENQKILDEINRVITSKAMTMYDKMKLSVAVNIFNEMIKNGEIDEVFDILIRLKEKRVMKILKKFDTKTATILMQKMRILKEEEKSKKENK
jgi:flagellar motility protein MotE (MotC chaperone)